VITCVEYLNIVFCVGSALYSADDNDKERDYGGYRMPFVMIPEVLKSRGSAAADSATRVAVVLTIHGFSPIM
jgi:hypothetical protein